MSDHHRTAGLVTHPGTDPTTNLSVSISQQGTDPQTTILEILAVIREFTGTDVAYVTEFEKLTEVVRWASGDSASFELETGLGLPLGAMYSARFSAGLLPGLVRDAHADDRTKAIPMTRRVSIGSYVGVPIDLPDGRRFGAMCVMSHTADPSLDEQHQRLMSLLAPFVGEQIDKAQAWTAAQREGFKRVQRMLDAARSLRIAFQPIVDLESQEIVGYEALARFADGRPPMDWLAEAWKEGHGVEFELMTLRGALHRLNELPWNTYLSVNISPSVLSVPAFRTLVQELGSRQSRIVLELNQRDPAGDHDSMRKALAPLRADGVRIAVDDVGSGSASLEHILQLRPDILKVDGSLTRGIDRDPDRAALVSLLASFAARFGASVVAEAIETEEERTVLAALGVTAGQGYYFAHPDETVHESLSGSERRRDRSHEGERRTPKTEIGGG